MNESYFAALATIQGKSSLVSLFDTETHVAAMIDSIQMVESDQEQDFLADFHHALTAAADKRDRVGAFMAQLESQVLLARQEIERLKLRKARYERTLERIEHYVVAVIQSLGQDRRGKWVALEGNTVTFRLKNNPPSVVITNEAAIPAEYKTLTITMTAADWEHLMDAVHPELREFILSRIRRPEAAVMKAPIAVELKAQVGDWKECLREGRPVESKSIPGAALVAGGFALVRE